MPWFSYCHLLCTGCEFGDIAKNCDEQLCRKYSDAALYRCCDTCRNYIEYTSTSSPSTTTEREGGGTNTPTSSSKCTDCYVSQRVFATRNVLNSRGKSFKDKPKIIILTSFVKKCTALLSYPFAVCMAGIEWSVCPCVCLTITLFMSACSSRRHYVMFLGTLLLCTVGLHTVVAKQHSNLGLKMPEKGVKVIEINNEGQLCLFLSEFLPYLLWFFFSIFIWKN